MLDNTIPDADSRQRALDPQHSFIVQAPAGSGKTELLTQRILVLLANVTAPEEVLAITFTKKAAAEMRARLIHTLQKAQDPISPVTTHAAQTWNLARKVLQRDAELQWNLLQNPNRLRIQTIDSFNSSLVKHLPISSHFGAPPEITDNSEALYREAVQEFLSHLEENVAWADAIAHLLAHLDNDLNKVANLLMNMLAKRDQWLPYIIVNQDANVLRQYLETHLQTIVVDALTKVQAHFPCDQTDELISLMAFANTHLENAGKFTLYSQHRLSTLPGSESHEKSVWLGICDFVLTKDFSWRKSFTINMGFPAPSSTKNKDEKQLYTDMKQRMLQFIEKVSAVEPLKFAFEELHRTPKFPYEETQWETLQALYQVLRIVVAQLKLVFQKYGKIDYIENANAALQALGTDEAPTDLALALDYQIKHILIDEFQDTSNSQYRLLEKLICGWENNDGRTLFIVGDPMQSIYRFREAEVGLFIGARQKGLSQIYLEPLTLSVNFRSTPNIVDWVNHHFSSAMPKHEDISSGAVTYSKSLANQASDVTSHVALQPCFSDEEQALNIVKMISEIRNRNSEESIAILVRSRTHLKSLIPAMKATGLAYRAIDIDALTTRPVIQDLMMLTRALLHPGDRIAWLAILRAPWCGLTLEDLLSFAKNPQVTIFDAIRSRAGILQNVISEKHLRRTYEILQQKLYERKYYNLRDWVESTWMLLGGPACLQQASELADAKTYFSLLEKLSEGGDLLDLDQLANHVDRLFAAPNSAADNSLQIMTIHNAKGLEFDTVILPHLERKSAHDDKQLLLWMERQHAKGSSLILAPIQATGSDNDSIYDYIKSQQAIKSHHEMGRLLYVAATRAKKKLYLYFTVEQDANKEIAAPNAHSLLYKIWDSIKDNLPVLQNEISANDNANTSTTRTLQRFDNAWQQQLSEIFVIKPPAIHQSMPGFHLDENNAKHIGTVTHSVLQKISLHGVSWWTDKSHAERKEYLRYQLMQYFSLSKSLMTSINLINDGILSALKDPRLLWILQPHVEAKSEFGLSLFIKNKLETLFIDRTFIDENDVRWVIDYKTATIEKTLDLPLFLASEQQKYSEKMRLYYQALKAIESREIRMGLYFPFIPAWQEWSYERVAEV